jgi:hypothetical protein
VHVLAGGRLCAAGYDDGSLRIFDVSSASVSWASHRHHDGIVAVEASADGDRLLSASRHRICLPAHLPLPACLPAWISHAAGEADEWSVHPSGTA